MKTITLYFAIFMALGLSAQSLTPNLNFEAYSEDTFQHWNAMSDTYTIDTENAYEGKSAAYIKRDGNESTSFSAMSYSIPASYGGKKIKLTGYIKTKNVISSDGGAGLWMRLDPQIGFDNMMQRAVKGTTDWEKYEIVLDLKPNETRTIVVGGLLIGTGEMWLDNFQVTIDGKTLENAPEKELTPAQKDTEFDTGSEITFTNLSDVQLHNLVVLGKVWGFLKYHHPKAASGNVNWDYELFRVMSDIAFAKADKERDQRILKWIETYGPVPECANCKPTDENAVIKPIHEWMNTDKLSVPLKEKLQYIYANRIQGNQYYIGTFPGVGNPEFKNENPYNDMTYPDDGFRVLALYRYWNMIRYYFPNTDIMDKDWDGIMSEYLPRFINAEDELSYEIAALQLIGEIQDTHANLWSGGDVFKSTKGNLLPPFKVKFIENKLVIVDYYNPEMQSDIGLKIGSVLTKINDIPVETIVKEKLPYYPASNLPSKLRDLSNDILRSNNNTITIEGTYNTTSFKKELPLFPIDQLNYYSWYRRDEPNPTYKMLDNNIGYISLANVQQDDPKKMMDAFKDTKGIIIDIRNYPTSFMVFSLGKYLVPSGVNFVKFTKMNLNNPGEFTYTRPLSNGSKSAKNVYQGKVTILVNELSQSQAEYTTMALRVAPRATVIGSTTAGADGNVSTIYLPGGLRTMISGIGIFYPDGSPTQRVGIIPDIEVKPTVKGIMEGRDELLEKAIEVIQNE